jgi:hypothetical protein
MDKGYSEEDAMKMCMGEKTEKGGRDMDPQELAEKLEALEGQVNDLTKRAEGAEAELADLKKNADEAGFDIDEQGKLTKRADPEYIEVEGERLEKSAVPAVILKALEAKEAEMANDYAKENNVPFEVGFAEITKSGEGRDLMNQARSEAQ